MSFFDLFKKTSEDDYCTMAQLNARAGKFKEAVRLYSKAIEINPDKGYYYQERAGALSNSQKIAFGQTKNLNDDKVLADYNKAIELYDFSLNNNDNNILVKNRIAKAYYDRGYLKYFMEDEKGATQDALKAQELGHPASDLIELTSKYTKE